MPCYRCGARQTDPIRGASPWKRGVRAGVQVLVCPECQGATDWQSDLDRCPACQSTHLVRRLGERVCLACGAALPDPRVTPRADVPGLAEDVDSALRKLFRQQ
jgi:ribosomal protein L37AE/L43A